MVAVFDFFFSYNKKENQSNWKFCVQLLLQKLMVYGYAISGTRPDIAFTTSMVSRHLQAFDTLTGIGSDRTLLSVWKVLSLESLDLCCGCDGRKCGSCVARGRHVSFYRAPCAILRLDFCKKNPTVCPLRQLISVCRSTGRAREFSEF